MALGEKRNVTRNWGKITQVSWTDWTAQDTYYGMNHSFQYAANINCDDEMHGLKLATKAVFTEHYAQCQLTSVWELGVVALNVTWASKPIWFDENNFLDGWSAEWEIPQPDTKFSICPGVVFQDYFWYWAKWTGDEAMMCAVRINWSTQDTYLMKPFDHPEATDESIITPSTAGPMLWAVTAILNYNNSRLVVACWSDVWVYYPELDLNSPILHPGQQDLNHNGETWWKKVWTYEAWVVIIWLTCSFEYLKVWAVDEWWNTKVYYYQGNNNLRNTFVYNVVDLSWVRVTRVYSINGIDYYVSSLDWSDGFVNLYKLVWNTPVQLFKQRAWLSVLDINSKAPYFVWPVWLNAAYAQWRFYIADAYGLFQFTYNPEWYDPWYMKRRLDNSNDDFPHQVYWVCENKWFLYVSTKKWCYIMRVIDTGKPPVPGWTEWFQSDGVLISREYEGPEGWTYTKMLDQVRLNYELNPLTDYNGEIDIYVSPNNIWEGTDPENDDWWYHVMHIDQENIGTRTERTTLINDLGEDAKSAFKFDRQTITYAIVLTRWTEKKATPIVRQIDMLYHCKDKINNVYDINNN